MANPADHPGTSARTKLRLTPTERRASVTLALLFASRLLGLFLLTPIFAVAAQTLQRGNDAARVEIGRAHVCTTVTNAHLVCRLLLEKKKQHQTNIDNSHL